MNALLLAFALAATTSPPAVTYSIGGVQRTERDAVEVLKQRTAALPTRPFGDSPLVLLSSSLPDYPRDVIDDEIEGVVELRFTIDEAGLVSSPQVVSSPDARLTAECLRVLKKWRFQPILKDGKAVRVEVVQRFPFRLQD